MLRFRSRPLGWRLDEDPGRAQQLVALPVSLAHRLAVRDDFLGGAQLVRAGARGQVAVLVRRLLLGHALGLHVPSVRRDRNSQQEPQVPKISRVWLTSE